MAPHDSTVEAVWRAAGSPVLRQPTPTNCGPSALVVARMLTDPQFAQHILSGGDSQTQTKFADQCAQVHRRTNALLPPHHHAPPAMPWPKNLGTPPWGVRRELQALTGVKYRIRPLLPWSARSRRRAFALLTAAVANRAPQQELPAIMFTGNAALPRHVVLVTRTGNTALDIYDPSRGTHQLTVADFSSQLGPIAWTHPWFVITPAPTKAGRR